MTGKMLGQLKKIEIDKLARRGFAGKPGLDPRKADGIETLGGRMVVAPLAIKRLLLSKLQSPQFQEI
jgi:hypothetical protein